MKKLLLLLTGLLVLSACSTKTATPKNDCLDIPCVPCILPIPYYPLNASCDLPDAKTHQQNINLTATE